jgi:hypothetical protein
MHELIVHYTPTSKACTHASFSVEGVVLHIFDKGNILIL